MAKKQTDGNAELQEFQATEWQVRITEVTAGKWQWWMKNARTGRDVSDGRRYTKLGRLLSSLVKFFKANQSWMGE